MRRRAGAAPCTAICLAGRARGRSRGFTLIEVMIVIVVVALLTAIALPSYDEYVRRGRRAEARTGLLQAAHWLERVATASGRYLTDEDVENDKFPATLKAVPSGTYAITIGNLNAQGTGYTLTATPQNAQAGDKCGNFTLDQAGVKEIAGAKDGVEPTQCWGR